MGRAFADGVAALLETYAKCLTLLKGFKASPSSDNDSIASKTTAATHRSLRRSIRSDRSLVRDTYSKHLQRDGKRLSRGDAPSRSKLRHVVDTLRAAIRSILALAKSKQPSLDYESLTTLSNGSRADAIQAMEDLSHRLEQSSNSSIGSRKKKRPRALGEAEKRKRKAVSGPTSKSSTSGTKKIPANNKNNPPPSSSQLQKTPQKRTRGSSDIQKSKKIVKKHSKSSDHGNLTPAGPRHQRDPASGAATHPEVPPNRLSRISMSTDSTKLGEIPYRRSRLMRRSSGSNGSSYEDCEFRPTYPRPNIPAPPPAEKKGFFRRLVKQS